MSAEESAAETEDMSLTSEKAASLTAEEVLDHLKVNPRVGLTTIEASRRRTIYGLNEVVVKEPTPLWKKYLDQFNNPFILLLLASAIISVFMRQFDDAASITFAIIIVVTVGFVQEYRSERTLERMGALLPPSCHVIRDGTLEHILAKFLVPGDIVTLNVGDCVPADLRLFSITELSIDERGFTGESQAKYKTKDAIPNIGTGSAFDICEMMNLAFQGTLVKNGKGAGVVISTGESSQFGGLFRMMREEEPPRTPLQKSMDILGKQLSLYSLCVIGAIMIIGCLQGRPVLEMFNVSVSLAVAAIPEGLPIVVTVTLAFGVMRMSTKNAVIKRLPTVEALGCVDYICSDKTGTLTSNDMKVYVTRTSREIISDTHHSDEKAKRDQRDSNDAQSLVEIGMLCNNAYFSDGSVIGSPTEKALLELSREYFTTADIDRFTRLEEIPFSSERKFMAVKCRDLASNTCYFVKGAPEEILNLCKSYLYQGESETLSKDIFNTIVRASDQMGGQGLRVLAMAKGEAMEALQFVGLIGLRDPPRPQVHESIRILQASKVNVCMVTGDGKETALAIASLLGLDQEGKISLSGSEVERMGERELQEVAERVCCYYRTNPTHKLAIVKALQNKGHVVAMTGDGVNDSVAIRKADVGISMGIAGTDVSKEAADMVLLDDDFSTILSAIEEGKGIFYNIQNFVRFQLSTSIAALLLISLSTIFDTPNPLNPMQILWINIIMDGPPAQSLGLEPVHHDVLKKPPRHTKEQILTRNLMINIVLSASIIVCGTLWIFKISMEDGKMTARDTTMTFTCFVFFDMFNALSSRSQERLIWEIGFFSNKVFCFTVLMSILAQLAVIYLPPLQYIFQTESLSLQDLLLLAGLSSVVFIVSELKKFLVRYTIKDLLLLSPSRQKFSKKSSGYSV